MLVSDPQSVIWAAWSLPAGALLDAALGDPRGWPHPVRAIGTLISRGEQTLRWLLRRLRAGHFAERMAGVMLAASVVGLTMLVSWILVATCDAIGPWPSLLGRSILIYWALAIRSLGEESLRAAMAGDLETARGFVAEIVGRDTQDLNRTEICRACVETLAENTNDAVIAPLFWFTIGGPVGLWAFKAVSTLDSMVGYRNARYLRLGWASARLDDLASFIPSRLTWLLMALAAGLVGEDGRSALRIGWRDGRKHPSPNAAWGETAMAGALGIRLGGVATYGGVPSTKPFLGDSHAEIVPSTVQRGVRVMRVTAILGIGIAWGVRWGLLRLP